MIYLKRVLVCCVLLCTMTLWARVDYADKNIQWGEVAESGVVRMSMRMPVLTRNAQGGITTSLSATPEVIETRTLTLESGTKIRIRERIEIDAQGEEDRVFLGGEQLSEVSIVASDETIAAVLDLIHSRGLQVIARYGRTGTILRVRMPASEQDTMTTLLDDLAVLGVTTAGPSQVKFFIPRSQPSATPNDPAFSTQWSLEKVGVPSVWARGYYGYPNIPCAVFDTGVRSTHEDLQENVHTRVSALVSSKSPEDHHGHGSHCLGIMGADGNNGKGISGVGQVANLTSIRGPISYWEEGDSILDGFQYALDHGIKVLSCSFGTPPGTDGYDASEKAIIDELGRAGCLVFIAAGNDGNDNDYVPGYPSTYDCDNIVAVICSNAEDHPANQTENGWATSYGATTCDIAAPGTDILSCTREADNAYESWSGTSMATPLTAACAAMIWERNPTWTYRDVRDRLYATATPVTALAGLCRTGARVDLARALDKDAAYLTLDSLDKAYYDQSPISLSLDVVGEVSQVKVSLVQRDDDTFSKDLGTFTVTPNAKNNLSSIWCPTEADKARGYLFRVEAVNDATIFTYSTVFRVRLQGIQETITVSEPKKDTAYDAYELPITFITSDAQLVNLAIEQQTEEGTWEVAGTLGMTKVTEGATSSVKAYLNGKGWISDRSYRVVVSDVDDNDIVGRSEPFFIDQSSGSVFLMPGNPGETLGESDDTWHTTYPADTEIRVTCWMPEVSLYWLYLIPANPQEGDEIYRIKASWVDNRSDLENGVREYRTYAFALPDVFANGRGYYLRFADAFSPEMVDVSPVFTITPRADGKATPSIAEALNDASERTYETQMLWYPIAEGDAWYYRSAWVGRDELAWFQTTVEGPCQLSLETKVNSFRNHGIFRIAYAKPPVLESSTTWTSLLEQSGQVDWTEHTLEIPTGTWVLRWSYTRDSETSISGSENYAAIRNVAFNPKAEDVKITLNGNKLSLQGGMAYPGYIAYTLDGSLPTALSSRWISGQTLTLCQTTHIRACAFQEGYAPGNPVEAYYVQLEGSGTEKEPYLIRSPIELQSIAQQVNAGTSYAGTYFALTNDIDCQGVTLSTIGYYDNLYLTLRPFNGTLDGRGHALINPVFVASGSVSAFYTFGLIGYLGSTGKVCNLTLRHPSFYLDDVKTLALAETGGGLVAVCEGTIEACEVLEADYSVMGYMLNMGGLVGALMGDGTITQCRFSGQITAQRNGTREFHVGGLVGLVDLWAATKDKAITQSMATVTFALSAQSNTTGKTYFGGAIGQLLTSNTYQLALTDVGAVWNFLPDTPETYTNYQLSLLSDNDSKVSAQHAYGVRRGVADTQDEDNGYVPTEKEMAEETSQWKADVANLNYGYPVLKWVEVPAALIDAPDVTPVAGPYADVIAVTAISPYEVYYTLDDTLPTIDSLAYTQPIELPVDGNVHILTLRAYDANQDCYSAPVRACYNAYTKPQCSKVVIGTPDANTGNQVPFQPGQSITFEPLSGNCIMLTCPTEGATIVYTLDGSEPSLEQGTCYTAPFAILGAMTIRARAFYPPWYASSATISQQEIEIIQDKAYEAKLTLKHAKKLSGIYWSETFHIQADLPQGAVFKHWLVTGPLVLETPTSPDITFPWNTKEALSLEAIYTIPQGYQMRIR